jgi:hypothetical protein
LSTRVQYSIPACLHACRIHSRRARPRKESTQSVSYAPGQAPICGARQPIACAPLHLRGPQPPCDWHSCSISCEPRLFKVLLQHPLHSVHDGLGLGLYFDIHHVPLPLLPQHSHPATARQWLVNAAERLSLLALGGACKQARGRGGDQDGGCYVAATMQGGPPQVAGSQLGSKLR